MRFKDIEVGQDYEIGEGSYKKLGRVIEKGTFVREVYHGRSSFRGTPTEMQGARVHWLTRDGEPMPETRTNADGEVVPNRFVIEWVRSQAVGRRAADARESQARHESALNAGRARAQRVTGLFRTRGFRFASCYYSPERGFQLSCDSRADIDRLIEVLEATEPVEMS